VNPFLVFIAGIVLLLALFLTAMPIAFSMGVAGFLGLSYLTSVKTALMFLPRDLFEVFSSYSISAIPMFVLMGYYGFSAGLGTRLYETAYSIFGHIRGGLAISTIFACAGFGAICGSCTATSATMGKFAYPAMRKYHYNDIISTGCIASSGTLGILIPPSVVLLLYGIITSESIGKLFLAGIIPGIIMASFMSLAVYIYCIKRPKVGPPGEKGTFKERIKAIAGIVDVAMLFIVVIGGLIFGFFTPTQAGGVGAVGAILIGLVRRELTWKSFIENTKEALRTSCMILSVMAFATIFGKFITLSKITFVLSDWILGLNIPPFFILVIIFLIYIFGGMFVDSLPFMILTLPIFFPIIKTLGYDPIWFGVIVTILTGVGTITPPVGINVYVVQRITDVPLEVVFKGVFLFFAAMMAATFVLIAFPSLTLFLPNMVK
jgi:tripartite ATP-independent transporter DctM subunit